MLRGLLRGLLGVLLNGLLLSGLLRGLLHGLLRLRGLFLRRRLLRGGLRRSSTPLGGAEDDVEGMDDARASERDACASESVSAGRVWTRGATYMSPRRVCGSDAAQYVAR